MMRFVFRQCLRYASRRQQQIGPRTRFARAPCHSYFSTAAAEQPSASISRNSDDKQQTDASSSPGDDDDSSRIDFFRVFGLPHEFGVDEQVLREKYRSFMKELHPDQHHHNNSNNLDEQQASAVTRAYDTLKRPHERATHLLSLLGCPLEEGDSSTQLVGACFLMDVMMQREEIEEAQSDQKQLKVLYDKNLNRVQECYRQLEAAFRDRDMNTARKLTAQLQYWNRIDETLREALEEI